MLYVLGIAAIGAPIVAALRLAEYENLQRQELRAAAVADEVLRRDEAITQQIAAAFRQLGETSPTEPCSQRDLERFRRLVVQSNLLVDVGYVTGDELICSSFGRESFGLGPRTYTGDQGYDVYVGVRHPLATDTSLIVVVDPHTGYAALVSQTLPVELVAVDPSLSVGLIAFSQKLLLAQRGAYDPAWFRASGDSYESTFYDGSNVVAWKRSQRFDLAAYASISHLHTEEARRGVLLVLLPIGTGAGALLLFVVIRIAKTQVSMPTLLRNAMRRGELSLVYQPIVDMLSGRWIGCEALVRWRRPNGELISPDVFIPIAERFNLVGRLTESVIQIVERESGDLLRQHPKFYVAINLSAQDFANPDIVERLVAAVSNAGIQPHNLHVEATERVFMNVEATRNNIEAMRERGIEVAIDDFGTGFSSLSYIGSLELDYLKIDKSFVDAIGTEAATRHVVEHIIEMAKSLKISTIAEGVETEAQAEYLRQHGVQCAQGWLYSKPLSMAQLRDQLGSHL